MIDSVIIVTDPVCICYCVTRLTVSVITDVIQLQSFG